MRSSSASNPTAFRFTSSPWDSETLSCCPGVTNALRKSGSVLVPFHHRSAEMSSPLKHKYGNSKDQSSTLWGRTFYITVWSSRHDCRWKPQPFVDNLFHDICVSQFPIVVHLSANWERWSDYSLLNWELEVGADVPRLPLCNLQTCGHNNTLLPSITGKQTCTQTRGQTNLKWNQSASRHLFTVWFI